MTTSFEAIERLASIATTQGNRIEMIFSPWDGGRWKVSVGIFVGEHEELRGAIDTVIKSIMDYGRK